MAGNDTTPPPSALQPANSTPNPETPAVSTEQNQQQTQKGKEGNGSTSRPGAVVSFGGGGASVKGKEKATSIAGGGSSRRNSVSSLRFSESLRHPDLPRRPAGNKSVFDPRRTRTSSPPARRFNSHVAFETTHHADLSKGPAGISLTEKHNGFRHERRAKTFMVGVDDNSYSQEALEWLLTSMVDDHDTVVCVRVIDKDIKHNMRNVYLAEAKKFMDDTIPKNCLNKAICLVVEYQFGRLGQTFEHLVAVHQPSMLVVGTKGKTKQGMQGVWNTRNSFSKYCLEKSAVPVVVVRPREVREKKKTKRALDPNRTTYARMLSTSNGVHESDFLDDEAVLANASQLSSMEEASLVAKALALPAEYDPTVKAYRKSVYAGSGGGGTAAAAAAVAANASRRASAPVATTLGTSSMLSPSDADGRKASMVSQADSSDDEVDEDGGLAGYDGAGKRTVDDPNKKARLHHMEVNEAAALKRRPTNEPEEDDD